ncbi:MAG TPA: preprotein translocase subunit SecY [Candidatus Fraserbacteria bacterium]|nr:preprotein translocase subunit SecY [Candidatus Fraserbacteria bacterium]
MLTGIFEAFSIPEVRKRILFTLGAIAIFRLGTWLPIPGVNLEQLRQLFQGNTQLLGFLNLLTGGALRNFAIFSLGVIPYINASIIMSLLQSVVPTLKELQQQGEEGRRVINRYTRYGTVGLAILQALGFAYVLQNLGMLLPGTNLAQFYFIAVITMTAGTMYLMWLGERITENGIGQGISMIIMIGIIATYPAYFQQDYVSISTGSVHPLWGLVMLATYIIIVAGVVIVQLGARRIEIQYAKRMVRGRVYGGQNTYIPFGINQGGVIPIIFAAALLTIPATLLNLPAVTSILAGAPDFIQALIFDFRSAGASYLIIYALMIIFFTYFYSAIVFNPRDLSDNLRKWGGFVPGIRPGKPTSEYVERIQNRLLLIGGFFLAAIAVFPFLMSDISGLNAGRLGGTSLLIVVGVGVDTLKQVEAHMVERHYESLIQKGAVLGRR